MVLVLFLVENEEIFFWIKKIGLLLRVIGKLLIVFFVCVWFWSIFDCVEFCVIFMVGIVSISSKNMVNVINMWLIFFIYYLVENSIIIIKDFWFILIDSMKLIVLILMVNFVRLIDVLFLLNIDYLYY